MLEHYPFESFRPHGEEACEAIDKAIADPKIKYIIVDAPTGCHTAGTKVIMYDGSLKAVEDITVGDQLMGPDSSPRTVLSLCRGHDTIYKVWNTSDGEEFNVNGDHILHLVSNDDGREETLNISVNDYLKADREFKSKWKLCRPEKILWPKAAPDNFNNAWLIGWILGASTSNGVGQALYHLDGIGYNNREFGIPKRYKLSPFEYRTHLISGIFTSAGEIGSTGIEVNLSNRSVAEDFAFVVRSVGLRAYIAHDLSDQGMYKIIVSGDLKKIPCEIVQNFYDGIDEVDLYLELDPLQSSFQILEIGKNNFFGFTLDKDNLYLLEDFTITHNSGKSAFGVSFARKMNSVVLTPTRILQEQYAETPQFNKEYTVKGKSNYNCGLPSLNHMKVDEAVCISDKIAENSSELIPFPIPSGKGAAQALKKKCASSHICPYYTKVYNIGKVPGAILNYDLFFRLKKYPGQSWGSDMGASLVMDEAHQLIDKVREIFGLQFSNLAAKRLTGKDVYKRREDETPVDWIKRVAEYAEIKIMTESDPKKVARFSNFLKKVSSILSQELSDPNKFYIEDKIGEINIKPLDLRFLKGKIFYPFNKVLMMSATFPGNFKEIFGIKDEESVVISIPASFPLKNRPVFFPNDLPKMNKDTVLSKNSPAIKLLDEILETHKNDKGIIHTPNYKFLGQLKKIYQTNKRFIWVNQDSDKNKILDQHAANEEPTILVSPSMMEGVDLKGNLARFGVLLKVPYPMLDEYTKRMMKIYHTWYDNLTATNVCQAYGRQVRAIDDWSAFYILDGQFATCLQRAKKCYSNYFLSAVKVGSTNKLINFLKEKRK